MLVTLQCGLKRVRFWHEEVLIERSDDESEGNGDDGKVEGERGKGSDQSSELSEIDDEHLEELRARLREVDMITR